MTISASFASKELDDVDGFLTIEVKSADDSAQPNGISPNEPSQPNGDTIPPKPRSDIEPENPETKPPTSVCKLS